MTTTITIIIEKGDAPALRLEKKGSRVIIEENRVIIGKSGHNREIHSIITIIIIIEDAPALRRPAVADRAHAAGVPLSPFQPREYVYK